MTKKLLYALMIVAFTGFQFAKAQVCTPDPQYTVPGVYPDSITGFPCAIVGSLYEETITVIVPADTQLLPPPLPPVNVDSAVLSGAITGLPPGMSYSCEPPSCSWVGGSTGCIFITGMPQIQDTGTYQIVATVDSYLGGSPVPASTSVVDWYFINVVDALVLGTNSVTNTTSCGASDGAIDLSVTGGTGTYIYSWSPGGEIIQDLNGLVAGIYTVTVSDTSCSFSEILSVTISDPGSISVDTVSVTHVTVSGGDNGAIEITVTGGTQPYTFSWTGPGGFTSAEEDLDTLLAGNYVLIITDNNNCSSSLSVDIGEPSGISEINTRSFSIVQNNPNPFADKTEIIFTTVKTGVVKFKVYNVLGKLVYSENIYAKTGANTIEFFTNDLPSGIYLYGLSDDKQRVVRKMVINGK